MKYALVVAAMAILGGLPVVAQAPATLVKNLETAGTSAAGFVANDPVRATGFILFSHSETGSWLEPWVTDGTEAGTRQLIDLNPYDSGGPGLGAVVYLGELNGVTYFSADDGVHGRELWRTDGTAPGTWLVRDINVGPGGGLQITYPPSVGAVAGGFLLFAAVTVNSGVELWRTDGTTTGTVLLKDIDAGAGSGEPLRFMTVGSRAVFWATTAAGGHEPWASDGTPAGTVQLADIAPGAAGSGALSWASNGGLGFFSTGNAASGYEPWVTDGTPAGTFKLVEGASGSASSHPVGFAAFGGLTWFVANSTPPGLWSTDGTVAGTTRVATLPALLGPANSGTVVAAAGRLFFNWGTAAHGKELWTSDGTAAGTFVLDLSPGAGWSSPTIFGDVGGKLLFSAFDPAHGYELWSSDGSVAGTAVLVDVQPGVAGGVLAQGWAIAPDGSLCFHAAPFPASGSPSSPPVYAPTIFYRSDGTAAGTGALLSIGDGDADPRRWCETSGGLFFSAFVSGFGIEPFVTDGTDAGTILLADINPGAGSSLSASADAPAPASLGGAAIFAATDAIHGVELWKSDGSAAGTILVHDVRPGALSGNPSWLTGVGGAVVFTAYDDAVGSEPWVTDGTPAGTALLGDVNGGLCFAPPGAPCNANPYGFAALGPGVVFGAAAQSTGVEPVLCGVASGGASVTVDLFPGSASSNPTGFTAHGGLVYFSAATPAFGEEPALSDGTAIGTMPLANIHPSGGSAPRDFTPFGAVVLFSAADGSQGRELWRTDGTTAGTTLLKDIYPGPGSSAPRSFTVVGSYCYFAATDPLHGTELWRTDGTAAGTILVSDVQPGIGSSSPLHLAAVGPTTLVFSANDGVAGREPWRSDGTTTGTRLVTDLRTGGPGSMPGPFAVSCGAVYFAATRADVGRELFKIPATALEAAAYALTLSLPYGAGSFGTTITGAPPTHAYFTAFSLDPQNGQCPGGGPWFGLSLTVAELLAQASASVPPFHGMVDTAGSAFFALAAGSTPPFLIGSTLAAVSITYDASSLAPSAVSPVAFITLN